MHRPSGFTLVEVMVALAITTVLLSTVYAGFWIGIDATKRSSQVISRNDGDRIITHFLRRQLRHVEMHGMDETTRFEGTEHTLRFSVRHFRDDIALYTLRFVADQAGGRRLTVEIRPAESAGSTPVPREVLMTDLTHLGFEYFGSTDDGADSLWHGHWKHDHAPQLVRLSYRRADAPRRVLYLSVGGMDANQ